MHKVNLYLSSWGPKANTHFHPSYLRCVSSLCVSVSCLSGSKSCPSVSPQWLWRSRKRWQRLSTLRSFEEGIYNDISRRCLADSGTQGQMVLESFVGMCMQDLSNEDTIADDPVEGKRRKVTRGTYSWKERYYDHRNWNDWNNWRKLL